ncbi:unnamed protein product [Durusdinium trenchii]|uniref:Dynein heavy chain linker domain-containing protein n=1 Tax=Durusdinium trenchii TaxID=1381693 RepID=A0ABP0K0A4_9DINO
MSDSGIIKNWSFRMSGLVARLMEAGLHHLCLKNLLHLLELFEFYSNLTAEGREGKMLTYMPPPVYLRMAVTNYEQHPLFYIQVTVERNGSFGDGSFIPSLELAIESTFACADTKSLDVILRRKKFAEVVQHVAQRWTLDTNKMDLLPDGAAHGGAPSANNLAVARNTAHMVAQLATGFGGLPEELLSSDDEPSVDDLLMAPTTRRQDIKVLFQDTAGNLEVKLTAHPTEFREVLGEHFRKVVELTEKYTTIDGSLQQDGEVKQQFLASLSSVQKLDLQETYEERITSCFFDPSEVVYEVRQYHALLQRFSHQEEQLKKMLNMQLAEVAGGAETPEGEEDPEEAKSQSAHSSFSEERFASGITASIDELREHLDRIDGWAKELNETEDLPERHLGLFVVDVTPLRKALLAMCACCRLRLMGVVQRWLEDACAKLKHSLQVKSGEIIMSPKHPDELHSTIQAMKSLDPFLVETAPVLASIRQMFEVLESRYHQVPRALLKRWYECIHAVPDLRDRAEKWQNIFRKDLRGKFNIRIAEKAKILSAQVQECRLVLEEYACKVSLTKAEFYYNKMHKLQDRVAKLQEQVQKQHVHEEMMEMPLSEFPGLAATAEQIAPLLDLWFLAHDWSQWQEEILFGEFSKIDPNGVKQKLQSCTETMKRLEEVFATQPRPRQVLHSLSLELTELRVLLPVIVSLLNPGLRERHWTLIGEAIDQNIQAHQMKDIRLSEMNERFPFVAHLSKIQAISETASKEMLIEEELQRMQEQWAKLTFEFKPTGVFGEGDEQIEEESSISVAELHHAEAWELITEQIAKVRALGRRPNAAVHEKDLVAHDAKLKAIGDLCDRLYEAQYGYVVAREHMLQEGLVKELMQRDTEMNKEWRRFFEVEKQWQNIMAHLRSSNTWLALLEVPKISTFCREAETGTSTGARVRLGTR